jgi:hypothetical protein
VVAATVGGALGLASLALEHAPDPWSLVSALAAPWLLVAFAVGAAASGPVAGAGLGVLALVAADVAYYGGKAAFGSPLNPSEYDNPLFWLVVAVPVGAVAGWLGSASGSARPPVRVLAVALVAGAVFAEAVVLHGARSPGVAAVAVAATLGLVAARLRRPGEIAGAVALSIAATVAAALVADHALGWIMRYR